MPFQGKFNYSATAKSSKKIPSFFLYAVVDPDDLRKPEFSYWVDLSEKGVDAVVEMSGCFRNKKYFDKDYLRENIEAATGLTSEPVPDSNIWESIPGKWNDEGVYEWPLENLDPPWDEVAVPGSVGSSSAGGGGTTSWHPYGRIAYAINVHGKVEWGGNHTVYSINSGGTQCGWTTADGRSAWFSGPASRRWGYRRGISAQDGGGRKYGATDNFKPINYKINNASAYGSCRAHLNNWSWYLWHPNEPSPNTWESHGPPSARAYGTNGSCQVTEVAGSGGYSSFRAGRDTFSAAGPGSNNAGSAKMDGYRDCVGYRPEIVPPKLYRYNPGNNSSDNDRAPQGPNGDLPFDYFDAPSKEPAIELPEQPTVKVYLGSSEWEDPMHLYDCAAGEFFAMHPLDIENFEINDPERPALNVHPIQKVFEPERLQNWLSVYGVNWGQEQDVAQGDSSYLDIVPIDEAKTLFSPRNPGIGESICAHHLVVVSSRHQIVILKLGAMPVFGLGISNSPDFVTQRIVLINIFDGVPSVTQVPVPLAQQAWEYYFNDGDYPDSANNKNEVNDFRYPEHIQKILRYHWWYHRGHLESVYLKVDRENGQESIETSDRTLSSDSGRARDKPNVSYFGTSDFIHGLNSAWYREDGTIKRLQGMPFQRIEIDHHGSGDSPYYNNKGGGSLNRDYIGYALTANYRLDLEKLWVCVGVGDHDWEKTFGSIVPTKMCFNYDQTYESAPWLYLAQNWTTLGTVKLKFIESNIKMGGTLFQANEGSPGFEQFRYPWQEWFEYKVEFDPNNLENITELKQKFGEWIVVDYLKNYTDYGEDEPPTEISALGITVANESAYIYDNPIENTLFWQPKKTATICHSTLNFPNLANAILLGVAAVNASSEIKALLARHYGEFSEEERHQLSREDRENMFRDDEDFYSEINNK